MFNHANVAIWEAAEKFFFFSSSSRTNKDLIPLKNDIWNLFKVETKFIPISFILPSEEIGNEKRNKLKKVEVIFLLRDDCPN